ncbi:hypothetical protein EW146_g4017 [Bondarzewia mesenterica]|uniref:Peptidyl-prolyl cis-trans isomerase n=1 Tax=Bondarzewia mesenterica TaxID=1095465 RepID=A0A4S4LVR9_9AGAM|nr:hypothetical protein EW146_g4017 [Bondarzewia mesenterica]
MIQGGDFTKRNGMGGESIYGSPFADEDLTRPLDAEGLLCMANKGPNTNGSQFFITLRDCPHLNGKHVVFGKILRGYEEVVKKIAEVSVDAKDRPTLPVTISNCGELELRKKPAAPSSATEHQRPASKSASESSDTESKEDHKRHKRRHRSRSRSPDDSDDRKRSKRKHKHKHHKNRDHSKSLDSDGEKDQQSRGEKKETEEEFDARLEREEKERIEAARRRELERIVKQREEEAERSSSNGGVRFKGRGRMKYVDPELHGSRS